MLSAASAGPSVLLDRHFHRFYRLRLAECLLLAWCFSAASFLAAAQSVPSGPGVEGTVSQAPASTAQNLTAALNAFAGSQTLTSVTLTGSVERTAGSTHETGTVTLLAKSDGSGRIDFALNDGSSSQIFANFQNVGDCTSIDKSGVSHSTTSHNCLGAGLWFLPQIVFPNALAQTDLDILTDSKQPTAVLLRSKHVDRPKSRLLAKLTSVGDRWLYFDPNTQYLSKCVFNSHPEDNALFDVEHEVVFSDYRVIQGVVLPFHIQHYVQNQLLLDITVSGAAINNQEAGQ
jgi:hypothetical protein